MHQGEIAGFMKALAPVIGEFVVQATAPLREANKALSEELAVLKATVGQLPAPVDESVVLRLVEETVSKLPPAQPGKDADPELVAELVDKAVAALDVKGEPGSSVTLDDVAPLIEQAVARHVAALPPAEPGKSVTVDDVAPLIGEAVDKAVAAIEVPAPDMAMIAHMIGEKVDAAVAALPPAEPGKSVTVDDVRPLLEEMVAALPAPEPGKSVTIEELEPVVAAAVEKAVADMPVKDPVGLAGALIDREGQLVVTLSDGTKETLGLVVGRDGVDVDMDAVKETIKSAVSALPKPKDGKDGFGFDEMDVVEQDGDLFLRFTRGEEIKDFLLPITTDRGVWTEREFRKGAGVTWAGSFWIAQRATSAKPDTPDSGWRLAVKRGRDGASAYEVARKNGFAGTAREWLDSLRPAPAKPVKVS